MSSPESPFEADDRPIEPRPVLPSGIEAGLVAGVTVAVVFLIHDALEGAPIRTPSILGTFFIEGVDAAHNVRSAPGAAIAYNAIHFSAWFAIGAIGALLMHRVEREASSWYLPWLGLLVLLGACFGLDAFIAQSGLPRQRIWLGALSGVVALAGFLGWRYPRAFDLVRRLGPS